MITLLTNPDAALLTLLAGILLIYFECNRPGTVVPGCLGTLLVLLSLNALRQLPLHAASLVLALVATILILLELIVSTKFLLPTLGTVLLAAAVHNLLEPFAAVHVHLVTALSVPLVFAASTLWLARIALKARRNKRVLTTESHIPASHRID